MRHAGQALRRPSSQIQNVSIEVLRDATPSTTLRARMRDHALEPRRPVEVLRDSGLCRDAAELVKKEKNWAIMLAGVLAFRFFLERTTDYEIEEIAIVAFFDWLQRGGSYRDPKMGEITKDEPR
jgi:hypothetical protein